MHFDILVEDISGKELLEIVVPKFIGDNTYKIIPYKGIGKIPRGLRPRSDAKKRILLDQLPRLIRGYGKQYQAYGGSYIAVLILVCDLDDKKRDSFISELNFILSSCYPSPTTEFCLAIEEGEAWLLGDMNAILQAYPQAKIHVLRNYLNDSICGTWELLADAIYPGGHLPLKSQGWQVVGFEKTKWARNIGPFIDIEQNCSPSFIYFRDSLRNHLSH